MFLSKSPILNLRKGLDYFARLYKFTKLVSKNRMRINVTNAGEATVQGIELDGRWQATESLLISYAAGYLDFEFDSFPNSHSHTSL